MKNKFDFKRFFTFFLAFTPLFFVVDIVMDLFANKLVWAEIFGAKNLAMKIGAGLIGGLLYAFIKKGEE